MFYAINQTISSHVSEMSGLSHFIIQSGIFDTHSKSTIV